TFVGPSCFARCAMDSCVIHATACPCCRAAVSAARIASRGTAGECTAPSTSASYARIAASTTASGIGLSIALSFLGGGQGAEHRCFADADLVVLPQVVVQSHSEVLIHHAPRLGLLRQSGNVLPARRIAIHLD